MATDFQRTPWLQNLHGPLILSVLAVGALGVYNLRSAAMNLAPNLYLTQLMWIGLGALAAAVITLIDYRIFEKAAFFIYGVCLVLLAVVLLYGSVRNGSRRWLEFGRVAVQPSEFIKLGLILALASYFQRQPGTAALGMTQLIRPFLMIGVPALLIMKQPDLGTAGLVILTGMSMVVFMGIRWRTLLVLIVAAAGGVWALWNFYMKQYQKDRVMNFLDPEADVLGTGYHAWQSLIAVGSGQLGGKGFMKGTQTQLSFLPEQQTDFAFSVWAEEWGFLGAAGLLLVYFLLLYNCVSVARHASDRFGMLVAVGSMSLIFWQMLINVAMVTGVFPVVGVPLPLFSYGGSSVLTVFVCVGIMLSVSLRRDS
ncbi:MAG: Peptidoglycan glycosyltransferase MrdB [Myxococcota bacterium]|nr:Peptidoglycan glycosyltransferase MrdB [Myxococcota bacterium]